MAHTEGRVAKPERRWAWDCRRGTPNDLEECLLQKEMREIRVWICIETTVQVSHDVNLTWNEVLLAQTSSSQRIPSPQLFHDERQNTATPQRHQLMRGGRWMPLWCIPRQSVAVIVPFRARDQQLNTFINHLHPFLRSQLLDFIIIVVEQVSVLQWYFSYNNKINKLILNRHVTSKGQTRDPNTLRAQYLENGRR